MNIASAFIKQVLVCQDFDTWVSCRKPYLPSEYHGIYSIIDHHCEKYHKMPSIEELKLEIRDGSTREKLFAIDGVETTIPLFEKLLPNKDFQAADYDIHWLEKFLGMK